MKLRFTPEAISDLSEIKRYIGKDLHNPSAAMRITKMILNQCSSLKRFPRAGAELSALTGYETELRLLICENYIALYRIDTNTVSVARIINARQDYMRILLHEKTDEDIHQQK